MRKFIAVLAAGSLTAVAGHALAQGAGAVDQMSTMQQRGALENSAQHLYQSGENAPEIYPGETNDVGPQSVLIFKPRKTLFEGVADSQYFHTDNAFLDHTNRVPSGVLVSTAQLALAPTPYELCGGEASPRLGFREQWYDFFEYSSYNPALHVNDFNVQTVFTDERWTRDNWSLAAGFDYNRLLSSSDYRQFYAEYVPRWEVQRVIPIRENQALSVSYDGFYHFTDSTKFQMPQTSFFDRIDQALLVTYNFAPCASAVIQPYYAFKYTHFTATIHRDDYLNSVGLGIYCFLNQWVTARAFVSYDSKYSSADFARYHDLDAGGGVNLTVRF